MEEEKNSQLNILIPESVHSLVRLHAVTSRKSINTWMIEAIQEKIESENNQKQ